MGIVAAPGRNHDQFDAGESDPGQFAIEPVQRIDQAPHQRPEDSHADHEAYNDHSKIKQRKFLLHKPSCLKRFIVRGVM